MGELLNEPINPIGREPGIEELTDWIIRHETQPLETTQNSEKILPQNQSEKYFETRHEILETEKNTDPYSQNTEMTPIANILIGNSNNTPSNKNFQNYSKILKPVTSTNKVRTVSYFTAIRSGFIGAIYVIVIVTIYLAIKELV